MHGLNTIIALNRAQQAAHDARTAAQPSVDPAHTFVDELRATIALYGGHPQLTPVERQVLEYASRLYDLLDLMNGYKPVFPLERR